MYEGLKWLRLTPDRPGRGGSKTGLHSFQQQPINDTRQLLNMHVYKGAWRRDFESVAYPVPQFTDAGAFACPTIHGYVYPSTVDPSATPNIKIIGQTFVVGASHFWDFTSGTIRSSRPVQTVPGQPAVFKNINQRCFGGDGFAEAIIMDDRTPAIHSQPNTKLGIDAPQQPLPLSGSGLGYVPFGTAYATNNSQYVNSPNPDNLISTIVTTDTAFIAHVNAGLVGINIGPGALPTGAVLVSGTSSAIAAFPATGTISITSGTSLVTLTGATWPAAGEYCGLAINFNGFSFVIAETNNSSGSYTIDGANIGLTNVQLLILGVYTGPTLTNVPYTITGSQFKMTNPSAATTVTGVMPLGYGQSTISNLVQVLILATQANGFFRNLGNISLGPLSGGTPRTVTDARLGTGLADLGTVASAPWVPEDLGSTMVLDLGAGLLLVTSISAVITSSFVRLADNNPGSAVTGRRAWWGKDLTGCSDGAMDNNVTATFTSATSSFTNDDVGKVIMVAGANPGGDALYTTIKAFINSTSVTIGANNTSGGAISLKQAQWGANTTGATTGPTYAYAWYDPETGHMSNISPTFQIPKPTLLQTGYANFANLTPVFNIDPGQIAYPSGYDYLTPSGDAIRFSHIVFFRTLSTGSSTLYPIGSLQPFVGKVHPGLPSTRGSWNPGPLHGWMGLPSNMSVPGAVAGQQWYDFSSDTDLILAGGFRAPQFTNSKPMVLLRGGITQPGYPYQLAYWDRRCWVVNTQEPDKIAFSCDDAQCPLGIPEESYPPTNFLRLPAEDGQVQGMRTLGDWLLITTNRFAYIVAGNNESNYRLMKISSSMPGVGTYQMTEFPTYSGAEGEPATLFFVGRDRIVYQWTVGTNVMPISKPVQDYFDTVINSASIGTYRGSRLHAVSAWGRRLVVFSPSSGQLLQVYDIDNQIWSSMFISDGSGSAGAAPIAMTTVYGGNVPVNEIYSVVTPSTAVIRSWLRDDQATTLPPISDLTTFPLQFDDKKTLKQICMVNIHATAGTWQLVTTVNESPTWTSTVTFAAYTDPLESIYGPAASPVDGTGVQDSVVLTAQFSPDTVPIVGYRFAFTIFRLDSTPGQIFAIDIGFKDREEPGEGDA